LTGNTAESRCGPIVGVDECARITVRDCSRARTAGPADRVPDFFVDQDGTVGILFTQVELGERMSPLLAEFKALHQPT
jgi:hypothetical protein